MLLVVGGTPGWSHSQDFVPPTVSPPPIPEARSAAGLDRSFLTAQARAAVKNGKPLPGGVLPDGGGNLVVLGTVKGNVIVNNGGHGRVK